MVYNCKYTVEKGLLKMLRRLILSLVVLSFVVSCARIQYITKDGIPLPPETLQITNPETQLSVEAVFVRYYEDSPESIYPKYLDHWKTTYLPYREIQRTRDIILFMRVNNPNEIKYTITKYIRYGPEKDNFKKTIVYNKGNDRIKHFQLSMPMVEGRTIQIQADVADKEGMVLFKLGYFNVQFGSEKKNREEGGK